MVCEGEQGPGGLLSFVPDPELYGNSSGSVGNRGALGREVPTTLSPEQHDPGGPLFSMETTNTWTFAVLGGVHFCSLCCVCQSLNVNKHLVDISHHGDPVPATMAAEHFSPIQSAVKQPFIMLVDSVGQEFRLGTAWKACLCSRTSGPQLEHSQAGGWNQLKTHPPYVW